MYLCQGAVRADCSLKEGEKVAKDDTNMGSVPTNKTQTCKVWAQETEPGTYNGVYPKPSTWQVYTRSRWAHASPVGRKRSHKEGTPTM